MYEQTNEQLCALLRAELQNHAPMRRKQLIESCAAALGLRQQEADLRPDSAFVQEKSRLGACLTELLHAGVMEEDAAGFLRLCPGQVVDISPAVAREFVLRNLDVQTTTGKQALFRAAERYFATDRTPSRSDDNALRSLIGRSLLELEREGHISKTSRGYRRRADGEYPATELGGWLREAAGGGDLKRCFLEAVHTKGGEWFEVYCVNLLRRYYERTGKKTDEGAVTGGSNDGGIDGIIHTVDELGYRETVLMQMKNRHAVMTAKDVREFYGAVCAEHGSRGIFITLSSFHPEAQKFIDKVDNLTGVDGERLFSLAAKCSYGLIERGGVLAIDEQLLLQT